MKITSINKSLGYFSAASKHKVNNYDRNKIVSANHFALCKHKHPLPLHACGETSANQNACRSISRVENWTNKKRVGVITECDLSKPMTFSFFSIIKTSLKNLNKHLAEHPEIVSNSDNSSEVEVINEQLEARTSRTAEPKTSSINSTPSKFSGENYPPVNSTSVIMIVITRDHKVAEKSDCLPDLFSLKLVEANYKPDPQLKAIRDMLVDKEPNFAENVRAMGGYLGQYFNNFQKGCLWVDEFLAIPIPI